MAKKDKKGNQTVDTGQEPVAETHLDAEPELAGEAVAQAGDAAEEETAEADPEQQLAAARTEAMKNWDLYLRERADLENFRKRSQREKEDAIRFANDRLLKEMVPVLDNLERALEHAGENTGGEGLLEGVHMTVSLFRKVLEGAGVKPIEAVGEVFDPSLHQAMGQVETDEFPPNTVSAEFQRGYLLNDRLLRPSLVMVAKAPTEASADRTENNS